jgi:hypothetical protein
MLYEAKQAGRDTFRMTLIDAAAWPGAGQSNA